MLPGVPNFGSRLAATGSQLIVGYIRVHDRLVCSSLPRLGGLKEREERVRRLATVVLVQLVGLFVADHYEDVQAAHLRNFNGFADKRSLPLALGVNPL